MHLVQARVGGAAGWWWSRRISRPGASCPFQDNVIVVKKQCNADLLSLLGPRRLPLSPLLSRSPSILSFLSSLSLSLEFFPSQSGEKRERERKREKRGEKRGDETGPRVQLLMLFPPLNFNCSILCTILDRRNVSFFSSFFSFTGDRSIAAYHLYIHLFTLCCGVLSLERIGP